MQSDEWHLARVDLPAKICRDIGRVIVRCGYMENYVQSIVYMLCNVDDRMGRVAIREPKIADRLEMISDLCAILAIKEPKPRILEFSSIVQDAVNFRNLCAHGAWTYSHEHSAWLVQAAKGSWFGEPKSDRTRHKKVIRPEGQIVRAETFSGYIRNLDAIIEELEAMGGDIQAQLESSPRKQP